MEALSINVLSSRVQKVPIESVIHHTVTNWKKSDSTWGFQFFPNGWKNWQKERGKKNIPSREMIIGQSLRNRANFKGLKSWPKMTKRTSTKKQSLRALSRSFKKKNTSGFSQKFEKKSNIFKYYTCYSLFCISIIVPPTSLWFLHILEYTVGSVFLRWWLSSSPFFQQKSTVFNPPKKRSVSVQWQVPTVVLQGSLHTKSTASSMLPALPEHSLADGYMGMGRSHNPPPPEIRPY